MKRSRTGKTASNGGQCVTEEGTRLLVPEPVFYNPRMELCRSICSLCVGAIGGNLDLIDGMCASGARGIRYAKENGNVRSLTLLDLNKKALQCARKNARLNKVRCKAENEDVNRFLLENSFEFVELDPFGSPAPFLDCAARSFGKRKSGYISLTATDMAVLCGAHHAACLKNYGAVPLNNEFCHENAARILAGKTVLSCAPNNFSAEPVFTLSHRHYVKIIFRLASGSEGAVKSVKSLGFGSYCPKCCWREAKRLPDKRNCPECGHVLSFAGPLYRGGLWDRAVLGGMQKLNAQRSYGSRKEIEKILRTMAAESAVPSFGYYDLHELAKKTARPIKRADGMLLALRRKGFAAERTHFSPTAIRTDAEHESVIEAFIG